MESNLDSEKEWVGYCSTIRPTTEREEEDDHLNNPGRLFRINPVFQPPLPALDDVGKIHKLRLQSKEFLKRQETRDLVEQIARQLIASSFYFHYGQIIDGHGGKFQVNGRALDNLYLPLRHQRMVS